MKAILFALPACTLSAAQQPSLFRLPSDAVPTRYQLNLTLDPEKTDYSGDVEIDLDVRNATSVIWLNASKLNVSAASIEGPVTATAQIVPGGDDVVGFAFDHTLTPGPVRLAVHFSAKVNTTRGWRVPEQTQPRSLLIHPVRTDRRTRGLSVLR